ncbi:hypothetical protein N7466_009728 [Penicillium verhagenii]|uniref:uncharacterized protein n=1 Tax=Penicillium verhagenii TaxID=1562060 RepID=UPI0025452382|nr:uncharacterized protein N7466_009728 [Penicillium verhagenii]KAJ5921402.1 hypothetical protein N7466_009728 [Penicillium verhagenii]
MCLYQGYWGLFCKHPDFALECFCAAVKEQLDRINDPAELASNTIPCMSFNECLPHMVIVFTPDGVCTDPPVLGNWPEWTGTNVMGWTILPFCDKCWETMQIPGIVEEVNGVSECMENGC